MKKQDLYKNAMKLFRKSGKKKRLLISNYICQRINSKRITKKSIGLYWEINQESTLKELKEIIRILEKGVL